MDPLHSDGNDSNEKQAAWENLWTCPCKGSNWNDPDKSSVASKCDIDDCYNYECHECLAECGMTESYLSDIQKSDCGSTFHCVNHRKEKTLECGDPSDDDHPSDSDFVMMENKETCTGEDSDLSTTSNRPKRTRAQSKQKKKKNKRKRKKKTNKKKKSNKKQKLCASDDIRAKSMTRDAVVDGLKQKNQIIATLQVYLEDDSKFKLILTMMKLMYQKNESWVRATDKANAYGKGGGPKPRWDYEQVASYIISIGIMVKRYDDIMEIKHFRKSFSKSHGLNPEYWAFAVNVAQCVYYTEYEKPLPHRRPSNVKSHIEALTAKSTKYDGLQNLFATYKALVDCNNIQFRNGHNELSELLKKSNEELRKQTEAQSQLIDSRKAQPNSSINRLVSVVETAANAVAKVSENISKQCVQPTSNNSRSTIRSPRRARPFDEKSSGYPLKPTRVRDIDHNNVAKRRIQRRNDSGFPSFKPSDKCDDGAIADNENDSDSEIQVVPIGLVFMAIMSLFSQYIDSPEYKQERLHEVIQFLDQESKARWLHSKYQHVVQISNDVSNVFLMLWIAIHDYKQSQV